MKSEIKISDSADLCTIDIEGTIGVPEEWQFDEPSTRVATYERFRNAVEQIAAVEAREVTVNIRSTGGDVQDALLIYDALKALPAQVTTRCFGYTASAATIIAQAASVGCRQISSSSLYLIHNSICSVEGNSDELARSIELLQKTDLRLSAIYAERSGRDEEQLRALMSENGGQGRWLSPEQTVEAGLADTIIDADARKGVVEALTKGLRKLVGGAATVPDATPDVNMTHICDASSASRQRAATFAEGQQSAAKTALLQKEDPSMQAEEQSVNEAAYAADARTFARQIHF